MSLNAATMLGGYFGVSITQVPKRWRVGPGLVKAGWLCAASVLAWPCRASLPWSFFSFWLLGSCVGQAALSGSSLGGTGMLRIIITAVSWPRGKGGLVLSNPGAQGG